MSLWQSLKKLYSLDTLDTRLTTSSKTPPKSDGTTPETPPNQDAASRAQPSLWQTPEYFLYYLVFITVIPLMFYVPYSVSQESDPEYPKFAPLLSKGWIPGRKVDNSDQQYASFRDNIPYMAIVVILHPLLRRFYNRFYLSSNQPSNASPEAQGQHRLDMRVSFDVIFAAIFLFVLHGFSAFKVLLIIYLNFALGKVLPRRAIPAATWIFNLAMLLANELCHGYPYSTVAEVIFPAQYKDGRSASAVWGGWLESHSGLIPRWEILFNITVLRLISFNMDYYWSLDRTGGSAMEKKQLNPELLSERDRVAIPAAPTAYNFTYYLSYVLYSPLYLAGPIVTFNDFLTQQRHRPTSISTSRITLYAIRFLLCLLTMELVLHFIYAVAISKANPDWSHYTPFQLSMLGFFNLHIIWLKLLLPWRFFRLWALLDEIDPPENMVRCMSDNYSTLAFWRGWHRSFNRWIVRYVFLPLGGSGRGTSPVRSVINMLIVFTFVALWHDISARLLAWSWLIVLFVLPETLCTLAFPAKNYKDRPNTFRWLCGLGAVGNILMMMAANLVGFALGLDGLEMMVAGIVNGWQGWLFLGTACAVLFVGVMVMFEHREAEKRKGIDLRY